MSTSAVPNPGSDAALLMGCTCPVMDNHHGHGFAVEGEVVFWINNDCPVHAPRSALQEGEG
jgi:hypothetical protein